jgi:nucleoside-diphosphate-sugar epimerase
VGTHLVIGSGSVGSAVARQLADAGADVVLVSRSGSGPADARIRRLPSDASSVDALLHAAPEAEALYNCANPAYHRWAQDWPPLASAALSYAERTGAVLTTCSNLYGYGPVNGAITESLPLCALGTKGSVRAQMWWDAKAAHDAGRIRATEVRGSDYIAPSEQTRVSSPRVVPRILRGRPVSLLGPVDQPHTWTAPIDVARLMVTVAADPRAWGSAWHVPSNPPRSQRQVVDELADAAGVPHVRVSQVPAVMAGLLGLVNPAIREMRETSHQWDRPFVMDDSAARQAFGVEPAPWSQILEGVIAFYRGSTSPR